MSAPTWIPMARSPSLGNGSLSIIIWIIQTGLMDPRNLKMSINRIRRELGQKTCVRNAMEGYLRDRGIKLAM